MVPDKLAFVDVETTGGNALYNKIIEIGILRVENNTVTQTFQTLLNPHQHLPDFISSMTGIYPQELEKAPIFADVMHDIYNILDGTVFVAHNVKFDYSFVRSEFRRQEITFSSPILCTAQLSRKLFPEFTRHNLDVIIDRFQLPFKKRHRAFDDAQIMWSFYNRLTERFPIHQLGPVISAVMKTPTIPPALSMEVFDSLPEQPGVYIFLWRSTNTTLYW